jgi:hypothetical protein
MTKTNKDMYQAAHHPARGEVRKLEEWMLGYVQKMNPDPMEFVQKMYAFWDSAYSTGYEAGYAEDKPACLARRCSWTEVDLRDEMAGYPK